MAHALKDSEFVAFVSNFLSIIHICHIHDYVLDSFIQFGRKLKQCMNHSFDKLTFFLLIVENSCGSTTSENVTYLVQTSSNSISSPCLYKVCPCSNNICRIRYDFTVREIQRFFKTYSYGKKVISSFLRSDRKMLKNST